MSALRSLVFNMFMFVFTILYILFFLCPLLLFPRAYMTWAVKTWAIILFGVLKRVVGLDYRIIGEENILTCPVIYSSKHQSAWDTAVFLILLDKPAYIVKEELAKLPFYGAVAQKAGVISVNRDLGAAALKKLVRVARNALDDGNKIIIFPEGTRTAPGEKSAYLPGVTALYRFSDAPVVPVALNSGLFWSRRSFIKKPGVITMEFLEPIEPGLDNKEFMKKMENAIETATERLIAEAKEKYPHL